MSVYDKQQKCIFCDQGMSRDGTHAMNCSTGGDRQHRHNKVQKVLFRWGQKAGYDVAWESMEATGDSSGKKPADLLVREYTQGKGAVIDVTVVSPHAQGYVEDGNVHEKKKACRMAARRKTLKYERMIDKDKFEFIPFAMETYGAIGEEGLKFTQTMLGAIDKRNNAHKSEIVNKFYAELSIALQQCVARSILARDRCGNL
jgi:hypothetical protein